MPSPYLPGHDCLDSLTALTGLRLKVTASFSSWFNYLATGAIHTLAGPALAPHFIIADAHKILTGMLATLTEKL